MYCIKNLAHKMRITPIEINKNGILSPQIRISLNKINSSSY